MTRSASNATPGPSEQELTLVTDQGQFDEIVDAAIDAEWYAIDTEFVRERTFHPVLSLVQLAWPTDDGQGIALLDPFKLDLAALADLFEGDGIALVHACSQDLPILKTACDAAPARIFDTQIAGAFLGYGISSLGALVEAELGTRLEKGSQLTDWTRRPLDRTARRYAASDVEFLHALYSITSDKLTQRGRLDWVVEENAIARDKGLYVRPLDEAWWRIKGKHKLRGDGRGVAQALARFRLEEASRRDIPTKRVLSDMAILAMAGRPPKDGGQLSRVRGLGGLDRGTSRRVLEAVKHGLSLSHEELSLPPKKGQGNEQKAAVALCLSWLGQLSQDHGIESGVLATRGDLDAYLAGRPSRLDEGWRRQLATDGLERLQNGKAALGMENGRLKLVSLA